MPAPARKKTKGSELVKGSGQVTPRKATAATASVAASDASNEKTTVSGRKGTKKSTSATKARSATGAKTPRKRTTTPTPAQLDEEAARVYVDAVIARGEAQAPKSDGLLPDSATHELTTGPSGEQEIVRKRFSAA